MTDYNLAGLSTRSFEQLIQAIALKVVSPGVVVFGDGADGGREATFNGLTRYPSEDHPWNGYIVIQAKFRQRPQNSQEDGEWALKQLKSELEDFANPKKRRRQPDYYIFATNVVLTPVQDKGTKDKADDIFQEFKDSVPLKGYDIWDYDKIRVFLDNFEDIRRGYAGFVTSGDVLSQIIDFMELRKELFADQYTNSEDIEVLVQKVRSHFDKTIQKECETLCTFNLLYSPMQGNLSQIYVQTKLNESQQFSKEEFSQERRLWEEVVRRNPKLMVLGKPGAGKTTLLQYIAVHCDQVDFKSKLIPVFISLKTLAENAKRADEISLIGYIRKKYCRSHVSEQELEVLLDNGRLLFLLDGLDEVTENKIRAVVKEIHHLVDEYGDNRVIVSCRKEHQAYKSKIFGNFNLCKIGDFEQLQIEEFVKNWFTGSKGGTQLSKKTLASNLIKMLKLGENKRIRELADTPLLLHLICLIFRERGDLPANRVDIYKEGIDLLLEKWNEFNDRVQVNVSELRIALRRIAVSNFEEGKSSFDEWKLLPHIKNSFNNLSEIEVVSGLLIRKDWKTYAFSHQTFQEYLIAEEFVYSQKSWRKLLIHMSKPRWNEIFLLTVEMLPHTNELLRLFQSKFHLIKSEYAIWDEKELSINPEWDFSSISETVLQVFITQAHQKSLLISNYYNSASIRALYFTCAILLAKFIGGRQYFFGSFWFSINQATELATAIDTTIFSSSFNFNLSFDIGLISAFDTASQLAYGCGYGDIEEEGNIHDPETSLIQNLTGELYRHLDVTIHYSTVADNYELMQLLQHLKSKLPSDKDEDLEEVRQWWGWDGEVWLEELRNLIIKHRNIGLECGFSYDEDELEILQLYYETNKLLIDCLNQSKVSSEVRALIEDNLFLPLDSSPS